LLWFLLALAERPIPIRRNTKLT